MAMTTATRAAVNSKASKVKRRAGGLRKRDRAATEARLFEAGTQVMSALGYDAATTKRIAEAAGVNEQLISRYFGGKEGLLVAILHSHTKSVALSRNTALTGKSSSLQSDIAAFLHEANFPRKEQGFARLALGRAIVDRKVAAALNELRIKNFAPTILACLQKHRDRGTIGADVDLPVIADALVHLRLGLSAYGRLLFALGTPRLNAMVEHIAAVIAQGLVGLAQPAPQASSAEIPGQ